MDQNNNESKLEYNFNNYYSKSYQQCPPTPRLCDFNYHPVNMNENDKSNCSSPKTPTSIVDHQDTTTPKLDEKVRKSLHSIELIMESMSKSNLSKQFDETEQDQIITNNNDDPSYAFKSMSYPVFKEEFEKEIVWNKKN